MLLLLYLVVKIKQYIVTSNCMFLDEKTMLEIWLNPGLNSIIFRGIGPWSVMQLCLLWKIQAFGKNRMFFFIVVISLYFCFFGRRLHESASTQITKTSFLNLEHKCHRCLWRKVGNPAEELAKKEANCSKEIRDLILICNLHLEWKKLC